VDLLADGHLVLRLLRSTGGKVRFTAVLRVVHERSVALGPRRTVTLQRGRPRTVSMPLDATARAALRTCRPTSIAVTVDVPGLAPVSAASTPVRLDPPDCGRFFGSRAVWNSALPDDAALDPNSAAITAELQRQVNQGFQSGPPPSINTTSYAPPVYSVGAAQPKVQVHLDRPPGYDIGLEQAFASVPLPPDARPAAGADAELVVWQPATDTMWEFWQLRKTSREWHASWGGRLDRTTAGPGFFTAPHANWGTSASSLPLAGGLILPRELRSGQIEHALAIAIPAARADEFALPAQRTDGTSHCADSVPEGARFRLDPSVNVDALRLPPPTAALARAAQRYGIIVRDQSAAVVFYAQNATTFPSDPYAGIFAGQDPSRLLAGFPWSHLQLVRMELARAAGGRAPVTSVNLPLNPCRWGS
jgi:hypothetical protein